MRATWAGKPAGRLWLLSVGGCLLAFAALSASASGRALINHALHGARMTYIAAPRPGAPTVVMLANADGSAPRALGPASTAVLSPSGGEVAAVRPRSGAAAHGSVLVLYGVPKKTATVRILRSSSSQLTILAWSPDDRWIAAIDGDTLIAVPLHGKVKVIASGTINGASFAPGAPDELVFAKAESVLASAPVNLYTVSLTGGRPVAITTDGLSEYPLWGPSGIVYSRELSHSSPTYQLWSVQPSGRGAKQLTNLTLTAPFYGLEPIAFSASGKHLLANLVGDNATEAWTVDLTTTPAVAHELGVPGTTTIGNAISRDGSEILLTEGSGSPTDQWVATIPWAGDTETTLAAHSAFASWNR